MATRSPLRTPSPLSALANRQTSSSSSRYVIVRVSPGSPSQWKATLSPPPASTCRSRQFDETFRRPPSNQRTYGGRQSITRSQGRDQERRPARPAPNPPGSSPAPREI